MNLKSAHLIFGIATLIVFLATGLYMRANFPALYESNDAIRFIFRANHLYILFSSLLNVALGLYATYRDSGWKLKLQLAGSYLLLAAAPIFIAAFFIEPPQASPMRPLTLVAAFLTLGGMLAHLVGGYKK
ncbi:MAG: hypothetical protein L0Y80_07150 [Ignavibacteriae bacterium]|nr:hypothetical protein [Ignavibacteriota bacterium]